MAKKRIPAAKTLTRRPAWKALAEHYKKMGNVHLRSLFADDPRRGERLAAEGAGLYLDYSKNRITAETIEAPRESCPRVRPP